MHFMDKIYETMVKKNGRLHKRTHAAKDMRETMTETGSGDVITVMAQMMAETMRLVSGDDEEKMREYLSELIPGVVKACQDTMSAEETIAAMHEMMPKLMESCLKKATTGERRALLDFWYAMLEKMEANMKAEPSRG